VAHVESVPACSKKVGRPKSKASCSSKLLVDSLAKPDLAWNNLIYTIVFVLWNNGRNVGLCITHKFSAKYKKNHVFPIELADCTAVVNAVATISVQLLFKSGRYSAYTCIDCQLALLHTHFCCHNVCSHVA